MIPDLPPLHPTSPGPVELDLFVDSTVLSRGLDGVFRVNTAVSGDSTLDDKDPRNNIADENCEIERQRRGLLAELENAKLKQKIEEITEELKSLEAAVKPTPTTSRTAKENSPADVQEASPPRGHRKLTRLSKAPLTANHVDAKRDSPPPDEIQSQKEQSNQQSKDEQLLIRLDEMTEENSSLKLVLKDALDRLAQAEQQQLETQKQQLRTCVDLNPDHDKSVIEKENCHLKKQLEEAKEEVSKSFATIRTTAPMFWFPPALHHPNAVYQMVLLTLQVSHLNQEKKSLLATLQLLQEELLRSEHMRGRSSTTS